MISTRFLIADDESLHNLTLRHQLEALGHEVVATAADGEEAVALAAQHHPDMAILDIRMPGKTGPEAAREIWADRPMPIVFLSAYSDSHTVEDATDAPAFHYLLKPVDPSSLGPAVAVARARFQDWKRAHDERDELARKLEERRIISRAKSILMENRAMSEAEAYRTLQKTSQNRNMRMVDLAKKIIFASNVMRTSDEAGH